MADDPGYLSTDPLAGTPAKMELQSDAYRQAVSDRGDGKPRTRIDAPNAPPPKTAAGATPGPAAGGGGESVGDIALTPAFLMNTAAHVAPYVRGIIEQFATSPTAVKAAGKIGSAAGAVVGVVKGGVLGLDTGARLGEKAASTGMNIVQHGAAAVANGMEAAEPYVRAGGATLSGAQGALDLAQMAEPDRRDIGVLGVGKTPPPVTRAEAEARGAAVREKAQAQADAQTKWLAAFKAELAGVVRKYLGQPGADRSGRDD